MRENLKKRILQQLSETHLNHSDVCENCGASLSTTNLMLRELLADKKIQKMRIGRNVYYSLVTDKEPLKDQTINTIVMSELSNHPALTMCELTKRCQSLTSTEVSKAVAKLAYDGRIHRHAKEKSRHMYYSTSNFVTGLLLVNSKRRSTDDQYHETVGPYLRQFLFNLPITPDA